MNTWINFRDMGIQCFLNFGDIRHIYFRDMILFTINKGIWDTWPSPLPGPQQHIRGSRNFCKRRSKFEFVFFWLVFFLVDGGIEDPNTALIGPTLNAGIVAL